MARGTVAEVVVGNAETRPGATAVSFTGRSRTFGAHAERALRLADALARLGVRPGNRVAILSRNREEYLEVLAACGVSGLVAATVNFRLAPPEIAHVLRASEPAALLVEGEHLATARAAAAGVPGLDHLVRLDAEAGDPADGTVVYEELVASGSARGPATLPGPDDPVAIVHTSGTTGRPKGAVLTQGGLRGTAEAIARDADVATGDRGLVVQPLFHVGAIFLALAHHGRGAAVVLHRDFDEAAVWRALAEGVTTAQLAPTMVERLLAAPEAARYAPGPLRSVFYSTAPIREDLLRRALDVLGPVLVQQYGSTEGGMIASLGRDEHRPAGTEIEQRRLRSAGRPCPGVAVRVVDDAGTGLPLGRSGEIEAHHPDVMAGYWRDPASTAETFAADGWLRTGDVGYLDPDGYLFIVDRKRDLIVSGGENIYPREVENALLEHPEVADVAVIGVPDPRWGESVLAVIEPVPGTRPDPDALAAHCRERIGSYKRPRRIEIRESLPRFATGKIDKVSLRAPFWAGRQSRVV